MKTIKEYNSCKERWKRAKANWKNYDKNFHTVSRIRLSINGFLDYQRDIK